MRNKPTLLDHRHHLTRRLNGVELTRWVKGVMPEIPIVLLTIHDDKIHRADALDAGADAYVTKARMEQDLLPAVQAILAPRQEYVPEYQDCSGLIETLTMMNHQMISRG